MELHTGRYANSIKNDLTKETDRLKKAAMLGNELGLIIIAGHGRVYVNISFFREIEQIKDVNIGHSIVCKAIDIGLTSAVRLMKDRLGGL